MSLKSKISILKEKADRYEKLNTEHIELQYNYDNLDHNYTELLKKYNLLLQQTQQTQPTQSTQSTQSMEQIITEKDNIIQNLQKYMYDMNYNYQNFRNYYNNLCNTLNITKNNENQLQLLLSEKEKEINTLKQNLENYRTKENNNIHNITTTEYATLLNGFYKKEQIMSAKLQNIIKEMNTLEEENNELCEKNELLKDEVSYLIGKIDDLKGNKLIIEKDREIKRLNMEIDNLEDYIDQKEIIIESFLDLHLPEKLIQKQNELNTILTKYNLLKKEIDEYKEIIHSSDDDDDEGVDEGVEDEENEREGEWCLLNKNIEIIIQ